jgi:hypothetical protein
MFVKLIQEPKKYQHFKKKKPKWHTHKIQKKIVEFELGYVEFEFSTHATLRDTQTHFVSIPPCSIHLLFNLRVGAVN